MPTIIDSLIVTLGLDDKKFKDGSAQVNKSLKQTGVEAENTGKKLGGAGKEGAKGFSEANQSLSKFLAVMAGAAIVKKFVTDIVQSNAEIYRFSRNLGQNARDISAWGNAVEITGGDAKAFQGTLTMLSRSQTELQMTGQSNLLPYFSRFNVAMMDMNGNARKGTDILMDFADATKGMDRTSRYNTFLAMGIDTGTANAMLEGRASLEALVAKQKEHGALTDQQALKAEGTRRSMTEAAMTARAFKNELGDGLTPIVKGLVDLFTRLDEVTSGWSTTILGTATAVGTLAASMLSVKQIFSFFSKAAPAAVPEAAAGAGAGAAATGGGILGFVSKALRIGGVGLGLATYSGGLNEGEDAELAAWRAKSLLPSTGAGGGRGSQGAPTDPQAFFEGKGWSKAQAAGIVANLHSESGMNPGAVGDSGSAYGVAQWHPDRQANFAKLTGKDIRNSTLAEQLEFVHHELTAGKEMRAGGALRNATSAGDAASIVSRMYERPADVQGEAAKRAKLAMLMTGTPGAGGAAGAAARGGPAAGGAGTQVTTSIGEVKVYTQATDAKGIARDIRGALNVQFPAQANAGLS